MAEISNGFSNRKTLEYCIRFCIGFFLIQISWIIWFDFVIIILMFFYIDLLCIYAIENVVIFRLVFAIDFDVILMVKLG